MFGFGKGRIRILFRLRGYGPKFMTLIVKIVAGGRIGILGSPQSIYFFWRASMNQIPSKTGLSYRGVVLGDMLCSRCAIREETVNHILWDCLFAKSVWWSIFNWIKLPFPEQPTTVQEILANAVETNGSKTWKKLIGAVIQVTAWEIWKVRNEKLSTSGKFISIERPIQ
ncbi:putative reverse transcriptase zinc-binding domain-containing protein [Helianthus annuus]|uniref:Reverse transcriptase zinc-binding domain-containing protein n=1 Tax=Helianthus annuus TaxID=4232 RepID=A0A9K3NVR7_HELAN|nr:putative reverse transcriptase zinc-binding domain-containing protein [Helianthus annuus]KAJ0943087.1 putative reverse transcriptase zinc-binding domain-containing protein [Helianthus annuus]